ncbi:uncharacterized protein LOC121398805 [Xenopus laevis]|uniref:Uncharacterized protein LOC121398805 n=1 Tax=Xenopus laevis TaxID=8355 RepID=A0A8J1LX27_XENLA|nr:uncharacterized protein LOC121398805 [Xenopus laevis]
MEVGERSSPMQQVESTQGSGPFINRKDNNDQCLAKSDEKPSQEKTFQDIGKEIWENMSQGYNSCVFAFGQTGSGKSFSLLEIQEQPSLVSFFCSELFNSQQDAFKRLRVSVSFVELCDEEMRDLLAPNGVQRAIKQSECDPSGPYAEGLSHHIVGSYETIKQMLIAGNKCRAMAANAKSTIDGKASQPWAIFTLTIRYTNGSGTTNELCRKVSFVDSGGSEGHEHLKLDSFMGINLSESSREITDNGVDQRDSLLSWLLNQFLGGKSKATIVAMIDPSAGNYQEILTALTSSVGAKPIVIQPLRPEDSENIITDSLQRNPDSDAYPNRNQLSAGQNIVGTTTNRNLCNNHTAEGDASNIQKPRENVKVFYWDEPPDVTFLESRLKERFPMISKGMSLIPLCEMAEDEWKSEARKAKIIIFCYSMQSRKHIEDETTYLQFCIGMNDLKEMEKQSENEKNGQKTLIRKHHQIGIFSRSAESDYDWLQTSLRTELRDLVVGVSSYYISNNGWLQFLEEVSQCTFGILYHTMRRGRLNITNVTDALYDDELKYMAEILGKENVIVLADDLEDSSPEEKHRILANQYYIREYACDLVLLTREDKEDKARLMEELEKIRSALLVTSLYVQLTEREDKENQFKSHMKAQAIKAKKSFSMKLYGIMASSLTTLKRKTANCVKMFKSDSKQTVPFPAETNVDNRAGDPCTADNHPTQEHRRHGINAGTEHQRQPNERQCQSHQQGVSQGETSRTGRTCLFIRKHHKIGIFSRSAESDYDWLQTSLRTELRDLVVVVRPHYISNNGRRQFWEEVSQCTFGILYHTMRRGRLNITNVTDALYDEELKYMAEKLGKENVIVVADDLEDNSPEKQQRILEHQPNIGEYACDLVLLTPADKKEKVQLMEKLKTIGSALHVTSLYVHLTEEEDDDDQIKNITEEITRLVNNLPKPVEKTMKEIMQRLDCDTPDFLKKYFKQAKGRTVNIVQFFKNFDLKEKGTSESKDSWELRRLNSLTDSLMQLVPVQRAKKKHKVGIFSRSAEDDYRWLHRFILSEFSDYVQEVRPCYISNYGLMQFLEELSQCSVAILYHTKNRGRINITDVEGSLYDEELQYLAEELGRDRVMVVVDDLEDSSSDEKERILRSQGSIGKWASDLILISTAEKNFHASGKSNYKQLLLEKFNRFTKV